MSNFVPVIASGSTNGLGISINATATLGDTIHTAVTGTTNWDQIELYAINIDTVSIVLTIEWGTAIAKDGNIVQTIQPQAGLALITPNLPLRNALVITGFAGTADKIIVFPVIRKYVA